MADLDGSKHQALYSGEQKETWPGTLGMLPSDLAIWGREKTSQEGVLTFGRGENKNC